MGRQRETKSRRVAEGGVAAAPWPHVVGQQALRSALAEAVRTGRAAHAYLFSGPRGVGKAAVAFEMAQRLLCERAGAAPCGACEHCRLIRELRHPDLHVIFPLPARKSGGSDEDESDFSEQITTHLALLAADPYAPAIPPKAKEIRVASVRAALRRMALKSYLARGKICVILHADLMNETSQNALLKVLEEPPPRAFFLLTTENESGLLPTIRSRCRRLDLPPLDRREIAAALRAGGAADDAAEAAAAVAEGSFSRARELTGDAVLAMQNLVIDFLRAAAMSNPLEMARLAPQLQNTDALPAGTALELLALFLRDAAVARAAAHTDSLAFAGFQDKISAVLKSYPRADYDAAARAVDEAAAHLTRAYSPDYVMYDLALRLRNALGPRAAARSPKQNPAHA